MPQTTFQSIINQAVDTAITAFKAGRAANEALADSLEEAAAKLRSGELNIDVAVAQAKAQQGTMDSQRSTLIDDG